MSQYAPLKFRTRICKSGSTWMLITRQQTAEFGITNAEYRYTTREEATREAIRLAYIHTGPVSQWPITLMSNAALAKGLQMQADAAAAWERIKAPLDPAREAAMNAYISTPERQAQLRAAMNW